MSAETFARAMDGVCEVSPRPAVFFGGFGEPFAHPDLLAMLTAAKIAGCRVELITNGTMLDDEVRHALVRIGVDRLWVSIDGATPLADPTRASILRMLAANACCVCEMAAALGVGGAMSQTTWRDCGTRASCARAATRRTCGYYERDEDGIAAARVALADVLR